MIISDHIDLDGDGIMRQAKMTAYDYILSGIADINKLFGEGTAQSHPEYVIAYAQIAALDGGSTIVAQQLRAGLDAIAAAIENYRTDHPLQGETFQELAEALNGIATAIDGAKK
jgi:hypothetical protein